jgi:hypothetical protein
MMTMACHDKEVRETLRGTGPCQIAHEVLKRNGKPNWWCRTHGMEASGPDGGALERCPGAWFDPVPTELRLNLDLGDGDIAIWGVVPPAIEIGTPPVEPGKIHVHRRAHGEEKKDIDQSFDIVTLRHGDHEFVVEGVAAVAFSVAELSGQSVRVLTCHHCGGKHIDELMFATRPHSKHLCNSCGRNFIDTNGPSISNPLADLYETLKVAPPRDSVTAPRSLNLDECSFAALQLWPSNSAIISTMPRPLETGFHVHAWDNAMSQIIDDTYLPVIYHGQPLDALAVRMLSVQRAVDPKARIISLACKSCGQSLISPMTGWIEPSTTHACSNCNEHTRTKRKVFVNPLAPKE